MRQHVLALADVLGIVDAMRTVTVMLLATVLLASGCPSRSYFRADAFYGRSDVVSIDYADLARRALTPDWTVDNFQPSGHPWPETPKRGPEYRYRLALDLDEDGRVDLEQDRDIYDLLLVHPSSGAQAWIRVIPLDGSDAGRDAAHLARSYVGRVSGGTYVNVELAGEAVVRERRLTTRAIDEAAALVDGRAAHRIRFDVIDVDRATVDPEAPATRVEVVLVVLDRPLLSEDRLLRLGPAVVVLGIAAPAEEFDARRTEILELWSRVHFLTTTGERASSGPTTL